LLKITKSQYPSYYLLNNLQNAYDIIYYPKIVYPLLIQLDATHPIIQKFK